MPAYMSPSAIEAYLLARVDQGPGDCWLWKLRLDPRGYALCHVNGKERRAARVAYQVFVGPVAPDHDVHHKCGCRRCLNPAHLEALPHGAHLRIHAAAGAWAGERNSMARLTKRDVQFIRLARPFLSIQDLAANFDVSERTIYYVLAGRTWRDVPEPTIPHFASVGAIRRSCQDVGRHGLNTLQRLQQQRRERGQPQPPFIEESIIMARMCAGAWGAETQA